MKIIRYIIITALTISQLACANEKKTFIKNNIDFAAAQTEGMIKALGGKPDGRYPRTIKPDGTLRTTKANDWTDGFFPGTLWYLYELTGEDIWKQRADAWTLPLEPLKDLTSHHDIGFLMYCSFGNGYRLAANDKYRDILIHSANTALTRFNPIVGSIESWNYRKAWNDTTEWFYPVIIDNMMNLELLFWATKATGDNRFRDVAIQHANTTMKNHIRPDFSCYHVVDYDEITGEVKDRATCQGFSDNSAWARGQAWGIYGFTMMFRETGDSTYLHTAKGMADFFINHPNLPDDMIPYWDFNAGQEGYIPEWDYNPAQFSVIPRDASAAAITASALFELQGYLKDKKYLDAATKMLHSLASPAYRAQLGANANFILMHSVGSIPHKNEIDVPLVYADYYFVEALLRYKNLNK